ncbi:hypothetical protein [Arthrobacter sp. TWP1-1]|uniref:hypothetical protein n=1 Tax=Arthrobacter sp. TWP1-1 TaxID=2804568 RepID=UPI003CE85B43
MNARTRRRLGPGALLAALMLAAIQPANAASDNSGVIHDKDYDFGFSSPAGESCTFPLGVVGTNGIIHTKEWQDSDGNTSRFFFAGKGVNLTYTNEITGKSVTIKTAGSVAHTTVNADGTVTLELIGHNGLSLFPADIPAGPSTKHHIGRVVLTIDANGIFKVLSVSGRERDICAELAN